MFWETVDPVFRRHFDRCNRQSFQLKFRVVFKGCHFGSCIPRYCSYTLSKNIYKSCSYHPKSKLSSCEVSFFITLLRNFFSPLAKRSGLISSLASNAFKTYNASKIRSIFSKLIKEIFSPRSNKLTVDLLTAALSANSC